MDTPIKTNKKGIPSTKAYRYIPNYTPEQREKRIKILNENRDKARQAHKEFYDKYRQQKQMETVLLKYIEEYVTCKTCKSRDTNLAKENRLSFLVCEACGSKRTVTAIKQGFRAQTEKRKLTRQA